MVLAADPIKVDGLRATRRVAGESQFPLPGESIDQTGLTNITPPQKRYLRESVGGELLRPNGTGYEFRYQSYNNFAVKCWARGQPRGLPPAFRYGRVLMRTVFDREGRHFDSGGSGGHGKRDQFPLECDL